jgi:hypothetical protein
MSIEQIPGNAPKKPGGVKSALLSLGAIVGFATGGAVEKVNRVNADYQHESKIESEQHGLSAASKVLDIGEGVDTVIVYGDSEATGPINTVKCQVTFMLDGKPQTFHVSEEEAVGYQVGEPITVTYSRYKVERDGMKYNEVQIDSIAPGEDGKG